MRARLILRILAVVAMTGVTASCISLYSGRTGIRADPLFLEERGEIIFTQYRIPVAEYFADYRVYSGPFLVDEVWDAAAIEERVQCNVDPRTDRIARSARVRMTVTLWVSYRNDGSRIALESSGRTLPSPESGESARCWLRPPFVDEILAAVAGDLPGGLGGRPGLGLPNTRRESE